MQRAAKKKRMRRRYRKMAAAVAGAAVISTALFTGFPVAKVLAAPNQAVADSVDAAAARDRNRGDDHYRDRERRQESLSPVGVVMESAATFGFDTASDSFSLLSQTAGRATVRVKHKGQTFKVDLERDGDRWVITTIRGIGDMNHPATYTPASFFPGAALTPATAAPAEQTVVFRTDVFDAWTWREASYPPDMAFGIALQDPRATGGATDIPETVLNHTDFAGRMLLFAHIGSVAPQGYGVGIAKVVRSGNDLTVTVRTKSPAANGDTVSTRTDDYLAVDRTALNFTSPIHVAFVDQYGTVLVTYTIVPR